MTLISRITEDMIEVAKLNNSNDEFLAELVTYYEQYQEAFAKIQHYLHEGDCYQVNLTQSFSAACQILGLATANVRDTATSSEFKGETQEDSVRTFSSYFDLIIMRTKKGGLAERMAWVLSNSERPVPIISGGSGSDQHPTQALLDVYTLQRSFEEQGGIDGKTIVFVGDLKRLCTLDQYTILSPDTRPDHNRCWRCQP